MKKLVLIFCAFGMLFAALSCKDGNPSDPDTPKDKTIPPANRPPGPPALVLATALSPTIIDVDWTDTSRIASGFVVERQSLPLTTWEVVETTAAAVTRYTDAGLVCASTYNYRVFAFNKIGRSFNSSTSDATTPFDSIIVQRSGVRVNLYGVAFPDNNSGFVVGDDGTILRTTDQGAAWNALPVVTTSNLRAVTFSSPTSASVVGTGGTIIRTTDFGNTWSFQMSGVTSELRSIEYLGSNSLVTVGVGGTILRSSNNGFVWLKMTSGVSSTLWSVSFTDTLTGVACGTNGTILWTNDGGLNWMKLNSNTNNSLFSVSMTDAMTATAVGDNGTIIRTVDGGATWSPVTSNVFVGLFAVSFDDALRGVAGGSTAGILHTNDGGVTWVKQRFTVSNQIQGIFSRPGSDVTVVGVLGMIVRTISCSAAAAP